MPIDTLFPLSQGFYSNFNLVGAATKSIALQSDDGDTTRIQIQSAAVQRDSHYVDALSAARSVSNVDVSIKSKRVTGVVTWSMPIVYVASTLGTGTCINPTLSYTTNTKTAFPRPTGSWSPADFPGGGAGAEIGISTCNTGSVNAIACTYCYADVTYEPPLGGFALFVTQWLPPLFAVASHGLLKREAAAILRNRKTRPAGRDELRRLLEAFKVRPRFCFQM